MFKTCKHHTLFELCLANNNMNKKNKNKKKKEKEKKETAQNPKFQVQFSQLFVRVDLELLCLVFVGAAPISYMYV